MISYPHLTHCPLCPVMQVSSGPWNVSRILSATLAWSFLRPTPQKPFAVSCTEVTLMHRTHHTQQQFNVMCCCCAPYGILVVCKS